MFLVVFPPNFDFLGFFLSGGAVVVLRVEGRFACPVEGEGLEGGGRGSAAAEGEGLS